MGKSMKIDRKKIEGVARGDEGGDIRFPTKEGGVEGDRFLLGRGIQSIEFRDE